MIKTKNLWSLILCLLLLLLTSPVYAATTVNIITTNDMHGVLQESDTAIGIAQASAMKASTPNSLLIDSGDATQGTTLATINKGNDIIKLMNAAGYDVMVAGNHEFDYGSEQLLLNAETANFPILSANADYGSGTLLPATHILEIAGKRIGVIGITTSTTNTSTNPAIRPGVTFGNEIQAAKREIANIKDQVDTILLLTHLGDDQTVVPVTSIDLLDGLSNDELSHVAAVLDGHSHTIEDAPYTRGNLNIPVIQDETQLSHIGKIVLNFNDDNSVTATEEVMDYKTAMSYPITQDGQAAKEATMTVFTQIDAEQYKITSEVIAQTVTPLWGGYIYWDYAEPRIVETNFGDIVTDAFKKAAQDYADENNLESEVIGIVNGGGIANSINPGAITVGDILNNFNHGNEYVIFSTTPSELYAVIENGLITTGQSDTGLLEREKVSGSFILPSGFTYTYDPGAKAGAKITEIITDKQTKLDRNDTKTRIIIGSQNYVQSFFKNAQLLSQQGGEDQIIENYFRSFSRSINMPTDGQRILIQNDRSPETYSVTIPVSFTDTQSGDTIQVSIDNGEFKPYLVNSGAITVTLPKGPHTLIANGGVSPVYINNYSGAGIEYTQPGYYDLKFSIQDNTEISFTQDKIFLAVGPDAKITSQKVVADLSSGYNGNITWTSDDPEVAIVNGNGTVAVITATGTGTAYIKATLDNGNSATLVVDISESPVVADHIDIVTENPDYFTINLIDVKTNPALNVSGEVQKISIFTWSDENMNDLDCKVATQKGNDWSWTFPVNDTPVNNYYFDAQNINYHIYGSLDADSDGSMFAIGTLSAANENSCPDQNITYISYNQNVGFVKPSVFSGQTAGLIDDPNSAHMEGLRVSSPNEDLLVKTQVHTNSIGWLDPVDNGVFAGTMGQNRPLESIRLSLYGDETLPSKFSIRYKVYQNGLWTEWSYNGEDAGITGRNLPIQAVQIEIIPN